jgi:formylglycine-generating enzyme required for sulfatase activity
MVMTRDDWLLAARGKDLDRRFSAAQLPISVGGQDGDDIQLAGARTSVQIGSLDGAFYLQAGRDDQASRVNGDVVTGSRWLADGDAIALGPARAICRLENGRLVLELNAIVTAGDTAPPDLEQLAASGDDAQEMEIKPIAFQRAREPAVAGTGIRRSLSRGALAIWTGFGVLAILAWFAFTAKSVQLAFEPAPDDIELPGTLFKLRIADRFLLRSGEHRVVATAQGYYPFEKVIEVGVQQNQSLSLALVKLPGLVTISTEPGGDGTVEVLADGDSLGQAPLSDVELAPGLRRLEFKAERFLPEEREFEVRGGGERQTLTVQLTPNWAPVTLTTEPPGAEVSVDGQLIGTTPVTMELGAGERELEARLGGYNAWQTTLMVEADKPQVLSPIALVKADGRVTLTSVPDRATVTVDGQFRGRTPLTLRLPPGRNHTIAVTKAGYEPVSRQLSVESDSGRRLNLDLKAQLGVVEVTTDPADAELWVDGTLTATSPAQLTLTALEHRIEARKDGYAPATLSVTPRPGFPQVVKLEMMTALAAREAAIKRVISTAQGHTLTLIQPGEFTMGASRREQGRRSNEALRPVKISQRFYLGTSEISNGQFREFRAEHDSGEFSGFSLNDDDQPVVRVTWTEAALYCNWLSAKDGLTPVYEKQGTEEWVAIRPLPNGYRLPTEAEWAWAARLAGRDSAVRYPWGDELPPPDRSGNYGDVSAADILPTTLVTYNDSFSVSAPVGSFPANPAGVTDLGGNVAEWMQDFYAVAPTSAEEVTTDPLGPRSGRYHTIRGASWKSATISQLRLTFRDYSGQSREDVGFRIARNLE